MKVVDISSYQGTPDFGQVRAAGVEGVIVKATEGVDYPQNSSSYSRQYATNLANARTAGLLVGHYHFARPEHHSAAAEFDWFHRHADVRAPDWVVLDSESSAGSTAWVSDWLGRAASTYGKRPIFYSYAPWIRSHLDASTPIDADLWLAGYGPTAPLVPGPWSSWGAWQFTSSATVPGIVGSVDMSDWRIPPHTAPAPTPPPPAQEDEDMSTFIRGDASPVVYELAPARLGAVNSEATLNDLWAGTHGHTVPPPGWGTKTKVGNADVYVVSQRFVDDLLLKGWAA